MKYIITIATINPFSGKPDKDYLGWQKPAWDEDGYFWTSRESIRKMLWSQNHGGYRYNTAEHAFIFDSKESANKVIVNLKLRLHEKLA